MAELHKGNKIFSLTDLMRACTDDIPKTAVITPDSLYEYLVMCEGLRNAGQTFQHHLQSALGDLEFVVKFFNDMGVASKDLEEHETHLRIERIDKFHLQVNLAKCIFGKAEVPFVGHIISAEGFRPSPEKVRAIRDYLKLETLEQLRSFVGLVNSYRSFLKRAVAVVRDIQKKDKRLVPWSIDIR